MQFNTDIICKSSKENEPQDQRKNEILKIIFNFFDFLFLLFCKKRRKLTLINRAVSGIYSFGKNNTMTKIL